MIKLSFPFTEEKIRALKVGDEVLIFRHRSHRTRCGAQYLHEGGQLPPEVSLRDGILYHCGPVVMKQEDGSWKATAAGPTDIHPRGAISMAGHPRFRVAGSDWQRRHGRQDAGGMQGTRLRVSACHWRRSADVLARAHQEGAQCLYDGKILAHRRPFGNLRWKIFRPW